MTRKESLEGREKSVLPLFRLEQNGRIDFLLAGMKDPACFELHRGRLISVFKIESCLRKTKTKNFTKHVNSIY